MNWYLCLILHRALIQYQLQFTVPYPAGQEVRHGHVHVYYEALLRIIVQSAVLLPVDDI